MRVTVTGATGLIGSKLVGRLRERGDEVTVLTRDPEGARRTLGEGVQPVLWDPGRGPAPVAALAGRDGVVHLAGEPLAQRWNEDVKRRIRDSREHGTRHLVDSIAQADPRPPVLVSSSASGYYGRRGGEPVDESEPPGDDFLAAVCVAWEREADRAATELGLRVAKIRTGIVLDAGGGALKKMLPPFRLGVGGPVAGGDQYLPWIHVEDLVGLLLRALDDETWSGPYNASAPTPVTNAAFSKALGRALHRPAVAPVPAFALKLLYGEMAEIVTGGVNMVPRAALDGGYEFGHPSLDEALQSALADRGSGYPVRRAPA